MGTFEEEIEENLHQTFGTESNGAVGGVLNGVDGPGPGMGYSDEEAADVEDGEGSEQPPESSNEAGSEDEEPAQPSKKRRKTHQPKEEPCDEEMFYGDISCQRKHANHSIIHLKQV